MKIAIASDLHLEFADITLNNTENADVLILAGDIMIAQDLHDHSEESLVVPPGVLHKPSRAQISVVQYRKFLKNVSEQFKNVVYVPGNHELYHGKFHAGLGYLRTECQNYPNIHFMAQASQVIDGINFIGCTLWTNMNNHDPVTMYTVQQNMTDYRIIREDMENYRRINAQDTIARHRRHLDFINVTYANSNNPCVVVTHHAPSKLSIDKRYADDFYMNGGYCTDLYDFIDIRKKIKLWIHGHMHSVSDYVIGSTRVVCNPRGYPGEYSHDSFTLKHVNIE